MCLQMQWIEMILQSKYHGFKSINQPTYLSVCLSVCLSIYLSIYLSIVHPTRSIAKFQIHAPFLMPT